MNRRTIYWSTIIGTSFVAVLALCVSYLYSRRFETIEKIIDDLQIRSESAYTNMITELQALSVQIKAIEDELHRESESQKTNLEASLSSVGRRLAGLSDQVGKIKNEAPAQQSDVSVGKNAAALLYTESSASVAPVELDTSIQAAAAAYREGRYIEASKAYTLLARSMPGETEFTLKRALSLYKANPADSTNYTAIERDLKKLVANGVGDAEALETLANIAMERGDFASAQAYFAQLADLHPADVDLLVDACECALLAGDRAGALRYFERASARAPEDPALKALRPRVEAAREAEEGTR